MSTPDRSQLARRITAALADCDDVELEQLVRMVNAIERRRTIQGLRELREATTYAPQPSRRWLAEVD